jgi:hypothetical protein
MSGEVWIDKHSFFVREIEGELEKSPSWWLKQVCIKVLFVDFQESWVQTKMEANADVRIVGTLDVTPCRLPERGPACSHSVPAGFRSRWRYKIVVQ